MIQKVLHYLWLLFFIVPEVASAQIIPMTVDIQRPAQFSKGDGPVSIVWQCSVSATGLLEGYFLVTAHDGNEQLGEFKSHDVVLHSGFHEVPMMLPPFIVDNPYSEISLKLSFVTQKERYDFEKEYPLRVGQKNKRTFAIGVCDPFEESLRPVFRSFVNNLKFESISPDDPIKIDVSEKIQGQRFFDRRILNQSLSINVNTVSINISPPDFPKLPIDCHQYDLLVITARGFDLLETRHLKAIHQWVRSGGSLCVLAGTVLEQPQIQFMNSLMEQNDAPSFLVDSEGNLELTQNQNIWFQYTGWGRSVIVLSDALENDQLAVTDQIQIPFFLWKLKHSQKSYFEKEKKWNHRTLIDAFMEVEKRTDYVNLNSYTVRDAVSVSYKPIFTGGVVVTGLMPAELRLLPSWIMVLILFSYVLIIGPGEYFILGKLRLRRFTWITFPLISIFFACLAFLVSNYFMQTTHERKSLNIIDLDSQGKPVKENQIELLFAGSYQNIETKIKSGLLTPLKNQKRSEGSSSNTDEDDKAPSLVGPPFYSGSIPTQYSVFQLMPQWTPQLNRIILNYPNEIDSKCDWSSIHVNQLMTEAGRLELNDKFQSAFGERAKLMIYRGLPDGKVKKFNLPLGQRGLSTTPRLVKDDELFKEIYPDNYSYPGYERKAHSFIDDLCVRDQPGLFRIVSQTSPAGGMNYEDLSILDPSDPNQWLVVVFVPGDTHDTVYRQLFHSKN